MLRRGPPANSSICFCPFPATCPSPSAGGTALWSFRVQAEQGGKPVGCARSLNTDGRVSIVERRPCFLFLVLLISKLPRVDVMGMLGAPALGAAVRGDVDQVQRATSVHAQKRVTVAGPRRRRLRRGYGKCRSVGVLSDTSEKMTPWEKSTQHSSPRSPRG